MKRLKLFPLLLMVSSSMLVLVSSCKKNDKIAEQPGFVENNMVLYWNDKANTIFNRSLTPPAQSRYFAIVHIAVHDALNSIKPKYKRFALLDRKSTSANPDAAVAGAAYWAIKGINKHGSNPIDDWYAASLATIPDSEEKRLGIELGKQAAESILNKRSTDNFDQANIQMPLPDGVNPGEYRSTLPFSLPGRPKIKALHQWGTKMLPFVTQSNDQFRPTPPYPVNSLQYEAEYNEVKAKGGKVGHTRTTDEDEIATFWVERSCNGWNRFARELVASKKMDAWKTARVFALLHTAMTDLASGNFEAKYHYFYWRPETAIRMGNDDGNSNTSGDPEWLPSYTEGPNPDDPASNLYTPPIPDYPSLHAGLGGAAAEILKLFFESDQISINQTSPTSPGVTRHYSSLAKAARDNSLSRLYVGFHFRKACLAGEEQGKQIAGYVFNHSFNEEK